MAHLRRNPVHRVISVTTVAALSLAAAVGGAVAGGPVATADALTIDFDDFAPGSPNGQNGWQALGVDSAPGPAGTLDQSIVVSHPAAPSAFGTTSLRISNAVTYSSFGIHTYSASLANEAGETGSQSGGLSGGVRQPHFEVEWDFASTVPGAEQPGLSVVASPDRGDGARMGWVQMADSPDGLVVNVGGYRDEHPVGSPADLAAGCDLNDDWFYTEVAAGLDRALPHTIKVTLDFLEGPRNDVVRVWVDGALVHVDTSWEDYFRYCEGNPTRTVDSVLFRTAGTPAPATAGNGFLLDNLRLTSGPSAPAASTGAWTLTPDQQTTTTATAVTTQYRARVQHPIKADGTTVFAAKKGVIPVRFELDSSVRTVVTETTITGDVRFESIGSDVDTANDFAALSFVPGTPLSFADLDRLVADYAFTTGNCVGGSLRWSVRVDVGGDQDPANDGNVFVYFGTAPSFTDCSAAASMTGQNLVGNSDARFDLTQVGGPFYGTYADALALVGTLAVTRTSLDLDSGWSADQVVTLTGAEVDGALWTPEPTGTTSAIASDTSTPFAKTCALPAATIGWAKASSAVGGGGNAAGTSQGRDTGTSYRIEGCRYAYNLDVSALDASPASRPGTYHVWVELDGQAIPDPGVFGLAGASGHSGGGDHDDDDKDDDRPQKPGKPKKPGKGDDDRPGRGGKGSRR